MNQLFIELLCWCLGRSHKLPMPSKSCHHEHSCHFVGKMLHHIATVEPPVPVRSCMVPPKHLACGWLEDIPSTFYEIGKMTLIDKLQVIWKNPSTQEMPTQLKTFESSSQTLGSIAKPHFSTVTR